MISAGGSYDQRTIRYSLRHRIEYAGRLHYGIGIDGRNRLSKRNLIGIDETEISETEITHGAGRGADVEGVPRIDQDHA